MFIFTACLAQSDCYVFAKTKCSSQLKYQNMDLCNVFVVYFGVVYFGVLLCFLNA